MTVRFVLLPGGSWTLLRSADPAFLPDGTILLDPHEASPARRMRVLRNGSWIAMSERDVARLYDELAAQG